MCAETIVQGQVKAKLNNPLSEQSSFIAAAETELGGLDHFNVLILKVLRRGSNSQYTCLIRHRRTASEIFFFLLFLISCLCPPKTKTGD